MVSGVTPLPDGPQGVVDTVQQLARLKTYYGRLPAIRAVALRIVAGTGNHDQAAQVNAIAAFVRGAIDYVCDPLNVEFITTPDVILAQIGRHGFAQGDCDDHALTFASLLESIGIAADVVGVAAIAGGAPDHVVVVAHLEGGDLTFDLVAKGLQQPSYDDMIFPS